MGALVGAGLSVAGATYQGLFRNPWRTHIWWGSRRGEPGAALAMALPLPIFLYSMGVVQFSAFLAAL